jgi:flagellar motor component MotA
MDRNADIMYTISGIVTIFVCVVLIGTGVDNIPVFYDTPSFFINFGILAGGYFIAYGNDLNGLLAYLLTFGKCAPGHIVKIAPAACAFGVWGSVLAGTTGTMIGLINMLSGGMDDPCKLASGAAVALITEFYAVLMALFFYILKHKAERRLHFTAPEPETAD